MGVLEGCGFSPLFVCDLNMPLHGTCILQKLTGDPSFCSDLLLLFWYAGLVVRGHLAAGRLIFKIAFA